MTDILGFKTKDGTKWLSNFWPCRIQAADALVFQSVEAAFQAAKHKSPERRLKISEMSAYEAMIEGRRGEPQAGWDKMAVSVMLTFLNQKFEEPYLADKLKATGSRRIAETNDWGDTYWGENSDQIGENVLGRLLMLVRERLVLEDIRRNKSSKEHH